MDLTPMWFGVYKALKYLLYPLSWILIAGLLALLTACLPVSPGRRTWVRRLLFLTVLLLDVYKRQAQKDSCFISAILAY